ncbi:MAG: MotA/TolQ/ExbB proton channel family protein [Bacteroidales bacterium]|nr:MotA/TolQ/ExbB proton channel family protein [Bacteroidales bacterium]
MKVETYYVVDSLGVSHPVTVEQADWSVSQYFVEGGVPGMIVLTLLLIALLLAAWKAPGWVREIGLGALAVSVFWTLLGLYQMFGAIQMMGDVSFPVICGGLRMAMISTFYGLIIYFISLIIRIIQKPRI